jgi:hypothetical protein
VARTIELDRDHVVLRYSGVSAVTRVAREVRLPYRAIVSVSVGLEEVPSALAPRVGLSTAPIGSTRQGQFWWAGKRVFLDFEDPTRTVVLDLKGNRFARVAVQPDTSPDDLAAAIRERATERRP